MLADSDMCSIRALYGTDGTKNATHGSANLADAKRELEFFFPAPTQAAKDATAAHDAELRTIFEERLQPTLALGVAKLAQQHRAGNLPDSLPTALGQWLIANDPTKVCAHSSAAQILPERPSGSLSTTPPRSAPAAVLLRDLLWCKAGTDCMFAAARGRSSRCSPRRTSSSSSG